MPPLVSLTPSSLDTSLANKNAFPNSSQAGFGSGIPCGPWYITGASGGDAWYAVACDNRGGRSPSGQDTPQIYKSTDDRLTWTKVAEMGNQYNLWNLFYPGSGTTLYLLVTDHGDAGLPPRLVTFDFATDTFGTPSSAHSTITFQGQTTGVQIVLIGATVFLIFNHASDTSIRYTSITAGVWAGSTTLRAGAAGDQVPTGGVQEAGGRYTFFWPDQPANKNNWWSCQISSLGVMGTPALAYSLDTTGSDQIINGTQLSKVVGNFIIFPFAQLDNSGDGNQKAAALIGTPLSAPVFTFAWVDPTGAALPAPISFGNPYVERDCVAVLDISGNLQVFFSIYLPSGSGTGVVQQIWYAQFDGVSAFNAAVEFFDSGTTPFPNQTDGSGTTMYCLSSVPVQKADGTWTLAVSTDFDSPAPFNLLVYVIYTVAGPPTLACPVDGGSGEVGVAYSKTLVRTGGTGPFTFSIIAGSLPPGLTLNASTGEIHGTPNTAGTFCYTAQVTDSNDLTATVDCCITIINGPIAACPTGDPRIGVAFSVAIPVSGGTEPYTFELTSGALPTGLSLNTSTGVISGTPSAYGTFSYTIRIADANDATVTISCSYVIVDPARTLRWQCASPGRPGRWFPHQYAAPVLTHYLVEPNENSPNDQELFMLAGGAILVSGGDTDAGAPITVIAEPGSIDLGDERAQKLYVDAMTEADQTGNISAQIRFNNSQQTGPTLILSPSGPREQFLENIASLADLSLYRNISVRYSWTGGPDGPRIYAFEPSSYLQPYLSTFLVTQFINLSFPAWKHHRRMYPALISNAPVIFTIKTQDGRSFITTIPSTGGQYRIIPLIVAHGCKQLAFAYQLDGQGTPFALFPESFTVETKSWDEATFIDLAVFKT